MPKIRVPVTRSPGTRWVIVWVDAQLAPAIAEFIDNELGIPAISARRLGMTTASDRQIFDAARTAGAVILTKDSDFVTYLDQRGPPPKVLWVRCGNTSNAHLRHVLGRMLIPALRLLEAGETLVELTDAAPGGSAID